MSDLADQMRELWRACESATKPNRIIASPLFFATADVYANAPPGIDRRKLKKLVRKAQRGAGAKFGRRAKIEALPVDSSRMFWTGQLVLSNPTLEGIIVG